MVPTGFVRVGSTLAITIALTASTAEAQSRESSTSPNYALAAQWTPDKVSKVVFDTTVTPRWLQTSDRFWYTYRTRDDGRRFMIVDPVKRTKAPLFDHAKMAATLTTLTRIPYDAQHLPFSSLRFVKNDTAFEFDVRVPADTVLPAPLRRETTDPGRGQQGAADGDFYAGDVPQNTQRREGSSDTEPPRTRTLRFEYDLASTSVRLLDTTDEPRAPAWASFSPDRQTIVFARKNNLFMMDAANYAKALQRADDPTIVEVQLTTDGEEHYSYARSERDLLQLREQDQQQRQEQERTGEETQQGDREITDKTGRTPSVALVWSRDSNKLALIRRDWRKVGELWVIDALATPRPKLESYRYAMPGEANAPQSEIHVLDRTSRHRVTLKTQRFADQTLNIAPAPEPTNLQRDPRRPVAAGWLSDSPGELYFTRLSRDNRRLDVVLGDTATGEVRTVVEERLNTYVETKPLRLVSDGTELVFWSERDGWGHFYLYDVRPAH